MSKVDTDLAEAIARIRTELPENWSLHEIDIAVEQIKDVMKPMMLELVGEDEERPSSGPKRNGVDQGLRKARNKVRAELRQKINDL